MATAEVISGLYAVATGTDVSLLVTPNGVAGQRGGAKTLVTFLHGAGGGATLDASGGGTFALKSAVSGQLGLPTWSIDANADGSASRPNNYGNSNAVTALDNARVAGTGPATSYASPSPGGHSPIILVGNSMGGGLASQYAARNPTLVKAIVLIVPLISLDTGMGGSIATAAGCQLIDNAYGGTSQTFNPRSAYNNATTYVVNDLVFTGTLDSNARFFRNILGSTGVAPPASGNNTNWNETPYSINGANASPSFCSTRNTANLASNAIPILLFWTSNDGTAVPATSPGVIPPIFSAYQTAVGASCQTQEITGDPTHNNSAPTIGSTPALLTQFLNFIVKYA